MVASLPLIKTVGFTIMNITQQRLFERALAVRQQAYAPYSHFLVGACILTTAGNLYAGCNVENASYGLSLCAEANAITQMVIAGERDIAEILVIGDGQSLCSPCGACRQRIKEFAKNTTPVHICAIDGTCKTMTLEELFPLSFGPENLV
jgi:cytidine deaminase